MPASTAAQLLAMADDVETVIVYGDTTAITDQVLTFIAQDLYAFQTTDGVAASAASDAFVIAPSEGCGR